MGKAYSKAATKQVCAWREDSKRRVIEGRGGVLSGVVFMVILP
jgi:hypothetical protein